MTKWEYFSLSHLECQGDYRLNDLGAEGWELVAAIGFTTSTNPHGRYVFKRLIEKRAETPRT